MGTNKLNQECLREIIDCMKLGDCYNSNEMLIYFTVTTVEGLVAIGKRSKVKVEYLFNEQRDLEFYSCSF